jgi:diaminopimelate decarboxylase
MSRDEQPKAKTHELLAELGQAPGMPLRLGGLDAAQLAADFGTPLYVYDAELLRRRCAAVQEAFGPRVGLLYALKANPCAAVAAVLREAGAGIELASAGELAIAERAGFAPELMQYAGPAKSRAELRRAAELGIGAINLESESEYERLVEVLHELEEGRAPVARVAIRVNLAAGAGSAGMRMAGGCSKFGVDEERVPDLAARIESEARCRLIGLHMYLGTQVLDAAAWLQGAEGLVQVAERVEQRLGRKLESLDFGGGFGVSTQTGGADFDLQRAGRGLRELLERHGTPQAWLELGRYLTAPAGVYLTSVVETKRSGAADYALLDGGMHQHAAAAGFGAVLRRPWPVVLARAPWERVAESSWRVGGPLCTPQDEFAIESVLPALRPGDVLGFLASGAYGASFSPGAFLGHPAPAELLVDRGRAFVVRERGQSSDALLRQRMPDLDPEELSP